jgi:hypothetical protein
MLEHRGGIGAWLWEEWQAWYFRVVKPMRVNDFSKSWVIWDNISARVCFGYDYATQFLATEIAR